MAGLGPVILIGAAIALFAASKKKTSGEKKPEDGGGAEGGETTEPVIVDEGWFYGQRGTARWMIFEEPDGSFTWVWRLKIEGPESSWPANQGEPEPTQQDAGEAMFEDMNEAIGPEGLPDVDQFVEPEEEAEPGMFDEGPYQPQPEPWTIPDRGPGEYGQ